MEDGFLFLGVSLRKNFGSGYSQSLLPKNAESSNNATIPYIKEEVKSKKVNERINKLCLKVLVYNSEKILPRQISKHFFLDKGLKFLTTLLKNQ